MDIEDINGIRIEFPTKHIKEDIKTGFEGLSNDELHKKLEFEVGMSLADFEDKREKELSEILVEYV